MALSLRRTLAATLVTAAAAAGPLAAQNAAAPSPVSVGVVIYSQFGAQLDSMSPANNFDVTRSYLNAVGRFSGGFMVRVTGDVYHDADATAKGSLLYRLKYAYAAWTPAGSSLTYRFGLTQTPWLDWEEALWDYRMQGTMPMERNGYVSSADFGAAVDGNISHEQVDFQVGVFNGENYNTTPGDQHKDLMGRASVRLLATDDGSRAGGLRVTGYAQLGAPTSGGTRNRFVGMVSYKSKMLTLAGEYISATDTVTSPAKAKVTGSVMSGYGVVHLPSSPIAVIGRVDVWDPNTSASNDKQTRIIAGLSYQLSPNVRLLADLDRLSFEASGHKSVTQALFQTQFTF
jgi:hypothetical protein